MARWTGLVVTTTALAVALGGRGGPVQPARAHSTGETGHSGKQGSTCNACHSGGVAPAVRFIGPAELGVGETASYRFEVQSGAPKQRAAGFNVAASDGTLDTTPDQGEQLVVSDGELTHTMPQANLDQTAGWDFSWTAPAAPGTYTLFGAGNSVNLNGLTSGDRSSAATFDIMVVAANSATPTPTATPLLMATKPPPPSGTSGGSGGRTPTAARTNGPTACLGDCDGSGTVTVNELVIGVDIALGNLSINACPVLDANGDLTVEINELVAAVDNALNGCGASFDVARSPQTDRGGTMTTWCVGFVG
jgi:hypothetical protein